mmetsp:Transcript_23778/g.34686  ORF Transcript_23778/g.34686 Transcript_23778/m.34686 type:complete len:200 (-) Transcript_23778:104-703(-)
MRQMSKLTPYVVVVLGLCFHQMSTVVSQGDLGNFRCITGHNYSSNWNYYSDMLTSRENIWWYYSYKVDDSSPLKETSCGPGFDGCRTEILIHEREAFDDSQQDYVPFVSAEMILSCTYADYCYPESERYMYTDSNTYVYHNDDPDEYTHTVRRIVECCYDERSCNIDPTGRYANAYAAGHVATLSAIALGLCLVEALLV